jgi:A/G-specific adenine glycosylase
MELGALVCTPRSPQCLLCPLQQHCVAFKEGRTEELPNLDKRAAATARRFFAFVIEHNGKFLVRQRPAGVVNGQLWEFPNVEVGLKTGEPLEVFAELDGLRLTDPRSVTLEPLSTVKHAITRYRITLEAFLVRIGGTSSTSPHAKNNLRTPGTRPSESIGVWKTPAQLSALAFSSAHKKLASAAAKSMLLGR